MLLTLQILEKLLADPLAQHPAAREALAELSTLFDLLGHMQGLHNIEFNMSLARGLDYYTGLIYEAVMVKAWDGGQPQVGSVAAGGRCVANAQPMAQEPAFALGSVILVCHAVGDPESLKRCQSQCCQSGNTIRVRMP